MDLVCHCPRCLEPYSVLKKYFQLNSLTFHPFPLQLLFSEVFAHFHVNLNHPLPLFLPVLSLKKPKLFQSKRVEVSTYVCQQMTRMNKQRPLGPFLFRPPGGCRKKRQGWTQVNCSESPLAWKRREHGSQFCITLANARWGERQRGAH